MVLNCGLTWSVRRVNVRILPAKVTIVDFFEPAKVTIVDFL